VFRPSRFSCIGVEIVDARHKSLPEFDPGPGMTSYRPKQAQNSKLFMKTIEENQSLKAIQFVKKHLQVAP